MEKKVRWKRSRVRGVEKVKLKFIQWKEWAYEENKRIRNGNLDT